ncbi:MAG TPA: alpha/beta hydrolase [Intrasporangium sp.]|uniref:alpha/beta hydrolase n=1 Tax=Intrasporangium sp. TaxID=1925024 RepID=UPI002F923A4E
MPQIGVRHIRAFQPSVVLEVAQRLEAQRRRVISATDAVLRARAAGESWTGPAAVAATARQAGVLAGLADVAVRLAATTAALRRLAGRMEACAALVRRAERMASDRGAWTDDLGLVHVPHRWSSGDPIMDAHVGRLDALMVDEVRRCLDEAERVAGATDVEVHRALVGAASYRLATRAGGDDLGVVPPPPQGAGGQADGAFANAAWWRSLTVAERRWVIGHHPEWVGPRDGIPAWDRHQANLKLLARARVAAAEQLRQIGPRARATDVVVWERVESIAAIDAVLGKSDGVTRHLLLVDITGPVVRAVTTVGNIDRAGHVATYVGGLSTSPHLDLRRYDETFVRVRTLAWTKTRGVGDRADVAIVQWMGYPAPQWRDGAFGSRSVLKDDLATEWADELASFTNGIAASRDEPPHQTLWAHSYGSVLAGFALQHVMRMDDVALFGSPGTALDSLAEGGLKPGALNVLASPTDVIAASGWFARDPRDVPGVANLSAACGLKPGSTNEFLMGSPWHSAYLNAGTTSEHNLAAIAAGRPDQRVFAGSPVGSFPARDCRPDH